MNDKSKSELIYFEVGWWGIWSWLINTKLRQREQEGDGGDMEW